MLVKGILSLVGGFIFIFAPGFPMRLIRRFNPDYEREGTYWGMGIYIITFFIGTFFQNLIMQIIAGGASESSGSIFPFLIGTVFTTLLLLFGMRIYLNRSYKKDKDINSTSYSLGFGIGMIAQVFTGMILITSGAGLIFKGIGFDFPLNSLQEPMLESLSNETIFGLAAGVIALILYRIALLTISTLQGVMVAYSITRKSFWFWVAALVGLVFPWGILVFQFLLGDENPGQVSLGVTSPIASLLTVVYYVAVFIFGYRWIHNEFYKASLK
jgi:uncharacterized membrane protein YhaH (DUF805 family)